MEGEARFTGEAPDLVYHEAGDLRLGTGPVLRAERRYLWHFGEGRVTVRFEDGRAFHAFPLTAEAEGSDHPCGEDLYRVTYDFRDWPRWRATWEVAGPRKDYTSISDYAPFG